MTTDEGMEVLTGVPAGKLQDDGAYPAGTAHYLVEQRLREMAHKAREFARAQESDAES